MRGAWFDASEATSCRDSGQNGDSPRMNVEAGGYRPGARRNPLAQALQEYGRLVKTNFVLDWLADQELRARVGRQLKKGEQLHALRRAIFYANEGHVRQRTPEPQGEQALCLAIVVNAIIVWNTGYTQRVLDELRAAGELITSSEIEHISPLAHAVLAWFHADHQGLSTSTAGPYSGRHGARRSTSVTAWRWTTASMRIWCRACGGTRCSQYATTAAMSSGEGTAMAPIEASLRGQRVRATPAA